MSEELARLFGTVNAGSAPALRSFQTGIARSNPYRMAAIPVANARFNMDTWSPGEALGVSAGQAFLAGVLQAMGDRREARQMESVAQVLPQLRADPLSVATPEGVDPSAFAGLKLETAYENQALRQKLVDDLFGVRVEGLKAKAKRLGEIEGENEGFGVGAGGVNPNSPMSQWADEQRAKLEKNAELTDFNDVRNKILVLQKAMRDPSSVADLDFVIGIAKILDPGSVVRESEGRTIIDSQSIGSSTLGLLNKALKGGSAVPREKLYDLAMRHYDTRSARVGGILDTYTRLAEERSVNPSDILPFSAESLTLPEVDRSLFKATADGSLSELSDTARDSMPALSLLLQKAESGAALTPRELTKLAEIREQMAGGR